jgi:hypothetical protein
VHDLRECEAEVLACDLDRIIRPGLVVESVFEFEKAVYQAGVLCVVHRAYLYGLVEPGRAVGMQAREVKAERSELRRLRGSLLSAAAQSSLDRVLA